VATCYCWASPRIWIVWGDERAVGGVSTRCVGKEGYGIWCIKLFFSLLKLVESCRSWGEEIVDFNLEDRV